MKHNTEIINRRVALDHDQMQAGSGSPAVNYGAPNESIASVNRSYGAIIQDTSAIPKQQNNQVTAEVESVV